MSTKPSELLLSERIGNVCLNYDHGAPIVVDQTIRVWVRDAQALEATIEELRDRGRWIPCSEGLPEPNIEVLVAFKDDTVAGTSQWTRVRSPDVMGWLGPQENKGKVITHWMSLPTTPEPDTI